MKKNNLKWINTCWCSLILQTQEKNGKVTFDCQHGPRECEGNIVHACVTNVIKDEAKQIAIVHCMIDRNEQPMVVGKKVSFVLLCCLMERKLSKTFQYSISDEIRS